MDHVPDVVDPLIAHWLGRHERIAAALARHGAVTVDDLLAEVTATRPSANCPWPASAVGPPAGARPGGQGGPRRAGGRGHHREPLGALSHDGPPPAAPSSGGPGVARATAASTGSISRAESPGASTSGDTSSATTRASSSNTAASSPLPPSRPVPGVAAGGQVGLQGDGADQRDAEPVGQALAASRAEERIGGAVLAREVAHVPITPATRR